MAATKRRRIKTTKAHTQSNMNLDTIMHTIMLRATHIQIESGNGKKDEKVGDNRERKDLLIEDDEGSDDFEM